MTKLLANLIARLSSFISFIKEHLLIFICVLVVVIGGGIAGVFLGGESGQTPGGKFMADAQASLSLLEEQLTDRETCICEKCGKRYKCEEVYCPFCGEASGAPPPLNWGSGGNGKIPTTTKDVSEGGGDGGGGGNGH